MISDAIEDLPNTVNASATIGRCLQHALGALSCSVALADNAGFQYEMLSTARDAAVALFRLASTRGEKTPVVLASLTLEGVPTKGPSWYSNAVDWCDGFWTACILRDRGALDSLASTPMSVLEQSQPHPYPPPLLLAAALRALHAGDRDAAIEACDAAIDACAHEKIAPFGSMAVELAEHIWAPSYRVLEAVVENDASAYATHLASALEAHPRYHDLDEERQREPQGLFSLPLTGIASLAHDRNLHDPAIRSPLIPEYMIVGAFRADG